MRNNIKNVILAAMLSATMLFSASGTVYAKDVEKITETVYVLLESEGTAREIIAKNNGVEQKDVKGELPFSIKIAYTLDGKSVVPKDILGQAGDVKITVNITPNSKTKTYFKENLALQMQFPIDMKGVETDITAKGLTGVTVGTIKTLSGIVLPAKSAAYEISYKTPAFELQSINFVCMPFDLTGMVDMDISSIEGQVTQLQSGITQYVDGVDKAGGGVSQADAGLKKIASSGAQLVGGYKQTTAGELALLQAMLATMPPEQQKAFEPQIKAIQAGQKQVADGLNAYTGGVSQASAGLSELAKGTAELSKNGTTLKEGVNAAIAPLSSLPIQAETTSEPESFLSSDKVSDIQFVMKTDALDIKQVKADVVPTAKAEATFWGRFIALFGIK